MTRTDLVDLKIKPPDFARYVNSRNGDKLDSAMIEPEQTALGFDVPQTITETEKETTPTSLINLSKRKLKRILNEMGMTTRSKNKTMALATILLTKVNEFQSALNSAEREDWVKALRLEFDSLLYKTETLVPQCPVPSVPYDVIYTLLSFK